MATLAQVKAQGQASLADQSKRNEAIQMATLLTTIDVFVEGLAERLENPNKAGIFGFGSPAPPAKDDVNYDKCVASIQSKIGNALRFRDAFGPAPSQYSKAKTVLDRMAPSKEPKLKYDNKKVEFLYEFMTLFSDLSQGNQLECSPYQRLVNLFMKSTSGEKYKFDYDALYTELSRILRKVQDPAEQAKINEIVEMAKTEALLSEKQKLPPVPFPSSIPATPVKLEEPVANVAQTDIDAVLKGSYPFPKFSNNDMMKITGIAGKLASDPLVIKKALNMTQIRDLAKFKYLQAKSRSMGGRKKTYRKKRVLRKTRKMRRV